VRARSPLLDAGRRLGRSRLPLGALLALGLGGLMLIAVGSVLALSLGGASRNTSELLRDKTALILSSIEQRFRQHLDPVAAQAAYVQGLMERGVVDPRDPGALGAVLRASLAATPQVAGIGFIDDNLQVVRVERGDDAIRREDWSQRPELLNVVREFRDGARSGWGEPVWSQAFEQTIIPFGLPVHRDGRFVGSIVPALVTADLSRFVAEFSTADQTAFVLHGRDHVLAHPRLMNGEGRRSRAEPLVPVAALGDPVLAAIWSPDGEVLHFGLKPGDRGQIVELEETVNGEADFIYVYRSLPGYGEKPWTVGAVLPAETAAREVERLFRIAGIGLLLLALAVGAAGLVGRRLARPVAGLVALAEGVERLEFGRIPALPRSRVRELDVAGQALNRMVAALRWFELYLPKRLVHRLLAQGDDAGEPYEREVTVMFTDIVGFSRLAARLTPSDTAAFLNGHFALLGCCIEAEGGTIDKYIGDSVMAFWGAPDEQADHAERACAAALAIARTLAADNAERSANGLEPVLLRIGISTGRVLVGNIGAPGRVNYTLVGDVVNLAQRLEQLGKEVDDPGDVVVLITEESRIHLKSLPETLPFGRREVRNRDGAVEVHRLA
jgi:class 3 adenylate cyclase